MSVIDLANTFNNKSIAIIGNGRVLFNSEFGSLIDSHDVVIRFNLVWPWRSDKPQCTGTKTTHMMVGGRFWKTSEARANLEKVMAENPSVLFFSSRGNPDKWQLPEILPLLPRELYHRWLSHQNTESHPSAGSGLLFYLTEYCQAKNISTFGMDGLRTHNWTKNRENIHSPCHSAEIETRYLAELGERFSFFKSYTD